MIKGHLWKNGPRKCPHPRTMEYSLPLTTFLHITVSRFLHCTCTYLYVFI